MATCADGLKFFNVNSIKPNVKVSIKGSQLIEAQTNIDNLVKICHRMRNENVELKEEVAKLQKEQLTDIKEQLADLQRGKLAELKGQIAELQKENTELKGELERRDKQCERGVEELLQVVNDCLTNKVTIPTWMREIGEKRRSIEMNEPIETQ